MSSDLKGTVAIITGASRGIGAAVAMALSQAGVRVALTARSEDSLAQTAKACVEGSALCIPADLSDMAITKTVVDETLKKFGRIDFLINNAGMYEGGNIAEADLEKWDRALDLNVRALMHLTRHALPEIQKNSGGAVINIASVAGKMTFAGGSNYCASKHAVMGFSGSVFDDVRETGVKVCAICPGYVNTDMVSNDKLDGAKMIQPEDIAKTIMFVLTFPDTGCPTEIVVRPQRSPYRQISRTT